MQIFGQANTVKEKSDVRKNQAEDLHKKEEAVKLDERSKEMVGREMGGHWSTEEERQVPTMRKTEGKQESLSEMRSTCKSHTNDKLTKGECCQTKTSSI